MLLFSFSLVVLDVTTSDIRLKKNIEKIDDALEMVLKLNGVSYRFSFLPE